MTLSADSNHRQAPTSAANSHSQNYTSSPNMARPSSIEPKVSKRKGTRSVSTLTPSQLARKRANDREAQRAIRARTKEHVERLESELDQLRSHQNRDQTVQELLRRNQVLEEELRRLKDNTSAMTASPYSTPVCDDSISTGSAMPSPRSSPFPSGPFGSSGGMPDYSHGYIPYTNNCETWAAAIPTSIPSNVSSPSSSANTDDYASYLPTSAPHPMLPSPSTSCMGAPDLDFDDSHDAPFHYDIGAVSSIGRGQLRARSALPQLYTDLRPHHDQAYWAMYPVYMPSAASPVH